MCSFMFKTPPSLRYDFTFILNVVIYRMFSKNFEIPHFHDYNFQIKFRAILLPTLQINIRLFDDDKQKM